MPQLCQDIRNQHRCKRLSVFINRIIKHNRKIKKTSVNQTIQALRVRFIIDQTIMYIFPGFLKGRDKSDQIIVRAFRICNCLSDPFHHIVHVTIPFQIIVVIIPAIEDREHPVLKPHYGKPFIMVSVVFSDVGIFYDHIRP